MTDTDTLIRRCCPPSHGTECLLLTECATSATAAGARSRLTDWAHQHSVPPDTVDDVVYAAYEAIANVVEHAYSDRGGTFTLHATYTPNQLCVTVSDTGKWSPPRRRGVDRGRGIQLIRALADSVHIATGDSGTSVEMHWQK